jgi:hypothetical protein
VLKTHATCDSPGGHKENDEEKENDSGHGGSKSATALKDLKN